MAYRMGEQPLCQLYGYGFCYRLDSGDTSAIATPRGGTFMGPDFDTWLCSVQAHHYDSLFLPAGCRDLAICIEPILGKYIELYAKEHYC